MIENQKISVGWVVWVQWVILSMLGWVAVTGLSLLFPDNLDVLLPGPAFYIVWALVLFIMGAGIALVQWFVLRRYFVRAVWWAISSGMGMLVGTMVAFPLKLRDLYLRPSGIQLDEIMYGAVFGFLMGLIQWLVFRTWVKSAGWWVVGCTLGWSLGMTVGEILPLNWSSSSASIIYGTLTEAIPIAVTGFALVILLRNPVRSTP